MYSGWYLGEPKHCEKNFQLFKSTLGPSPFRTDPEDRKKITFPPGKSVLCLTVDKNILKLLDFIGFSKTLYAFLSNWNKEEPCACSPDFFAWNYWIIYLYDESLQIEINLVSTNTIILKTLYNRRIQETTIASPVRNVYQKCPMLTKGFGCIYPWNQSLPYVLPQPSLVFLCD